MASSAIGVQGDVSVFAGLDGLHDRIRESAAHLDIASRKLAAI